MSSCLLPSCSAQGVSDATTAAGRLLAARLAYTCAQRGAGSLDQSQLGDGRLLSFGYKVFGFPTGLHEGVLLGSAESCQLSGLKEFAGNVGARLLKITRTAPGPVISGQVHTERLRRWIVVHRYARARELLPLEANYDDTLASFGRHTRRNIRNVRKVGSDAGFTFDISSGSAMIAPNDRATLARRTRPTGVRVALSRRLEMHADRAGRPFRSVVRAPGGEIVSYACGYLGEPGSGYLLYQLNNPAFNALSPSLLLRAYLIEWLIERGCHEFVFVHGCTGILQHACLRQPLEELFLMRRSPVGYLAASPIAFAKADSSLGRLVRAAVLPV